MGIWFKSLNHGLILRKVHRVIRFNQKAWLKPYIDINTKLRQKAKNNLEKDLMYNAVFGKIMENVRKHRNIKLVTTKRRRNYLVSEPNYHTNFFTENLLAIELRKTQILINKPVYLGLSVLDLSKTVKYEFWYDYVKPKYGESANLCYMDTGSFIVHVKQMIFTKILQKMLTLQRFGTSNCEIDRLFCKGKKEESTWTSERRVRCTNHKRICWIKIKNI